jgi:Uma2 family endonuclease
MAATTEEHPPMASAVETQVEPLLTIEEFARRPAPGYPTELVRGRIVRMNVPKPYHGWVCLNAGRILATFAEAHDLGYVMSNDSGVITGRNPDTLRGADVAFYSHAKVPKGSLPRDQYLDVVPDLVVEVRSPDDRWPKVIEKVADYLNAGVPVVLLLDPEDEHLYVYSADAPVRTLAASDELTLPAILPGLAVTVGRFFA